MALGAGVLAAPLPSVAQQPPTKMPRIGYLYFRSAPEFRDEFFRQGLRELGYVEGKTIVVEYRYAQGKPDLLREFAAELVRLKSDVIVSAGPISTRAAKEAAVAIPIVTAFDTDPVGAAFVASLARPGGNITGLSTPAPKISGKQLEFLREIVPKLARVAILGNSTQPGCDQLLGEVKLVAGKFGVKLQYLNAVERKDMEPAFAAAKKERADAVLMLVAGTDLLARRAQIVELALKNRLPSMFNAREYVEAGGLMSYGVSLNDLFRRAATYADKILKGAKPADLPVEEPTKFELFLNGKTAKTPGVKIPESLLTMANKVIE